MYQRNSNSAFFLDSLGHVFAELTAKRSVSPSWLLTDSGLLGEVFRGPFQQDAHEFLLAVLSACDAECASGIDAPGPTMIGQLFTGEVTSSMKCRLCGFEVVNRTQYYDITIPMNSGDVAAAVDSAVSATEVPAPGQCEGCGCTNCLLRGHSYRSFPLILILTMLRFDNELRKIEDFMAFPKKLSVPGGLEYELYGMVVHNGRLIRHGHFFAFVKDEGGVWYRADDVCVYRVKEEAVLRACPYVLFYKRV
jgi:uncharacterized UBP type Zn finger protein